MTTKMFAAAALLVLTTGVPAMADSAAGTPPAPTAKAEDSDATKMVCRRIESIGTRLGSKKVCRSKGDWDAEQAANRQDLERSQTQRWKSD